MTDLDRWRSDTPGCLHRIHLNNGGAALVPASVEQVIERYLQLESHIGGYEAHEIAAAEIRETYTAISDLVRCRPFEIAVVENATVAFAQALSAFDFRSGDVIVTSEADYPSNQLMYLSLARRQGIEVHRAANLPEGGVDPDSVRDLAKNPRCRLVALTWAPTADGVIQDAESVGAVCAELEIPYILDACQALGQLPIDVGQLKCDFMGATARKFLRGPRGVGFLYVSERMLTRGAYPLYIDQRGADWLQPNAFSLARDARRFENWEFAYALVLGMREAARYMAAVGDETYTRPKALAAKLRELLATVPRIHLTDSGTNKSAIVTATVDGRDLEEVKMAMRARSINVWACEGRLRLSPHYYNTDQELTTAVAALREVLQ